MADKKISALTALIQANVDTANDVLPIVDTNATETKKVTPAALVGAAAAAGLTNVDINSGTIDGVTIATSDITVGSGKTLNVSGGTLTLANDQISGDSVEGGTINAITINTLGGTTANVTTVNATTVDATNVEVTNVKAKDGTAAITISDSSGNVGIGTASPLSILQVGDGTDAIAMTGTAPLLAVKGASFSTGLIVRRDGFAEAGIQSSGTGNFGTWTSHDVVFTTNGFERMRIDTSGNVGIGGTAAAFSKLQITGTLAEGSGFTIPYNLNGTIPSTATTAYGYYSTPTTAAASFTLTTLNHFFANPPAFGAGSTVTNQYGFHAGSTLTGATNNYGFYSNIASGSGRYNFYAAGTADNYFAGNVGIGTTPGAKLDVYNSAAAAANNEVLRLRYNTAVTPGTSGDLNFTNAAGTVLGRISNIVEDGSNVGLGFSTFSSSLAQRVLISGNGNVGIGTSSPNKSSLSTALTFNTGTAGNYSAVEWASGDTLNYHISANNSAIYHVAAGTRPWIVYTNGGERMRIDSSGNVGIGGTALAYAKVDVSGTYPSGSATSAAFYARGTVPSGSTADYVGAWVAGGTAASAFTLARAQGFLYSGTAVGAGSTITNQYGFRATSGVTGATNNYGFYSEIASAANRWNFYAAGTAQNYMAGNLLLGVSSPGYTSRFVSRGATSDSTAWHIYGETSAGTYTLSVRNDGKFYTGIAASSPYNDTTANAANVVVDSNGLLQRSTSSLRYKSDVADATHGLADVLKLRSVTYKAKNSGDTVFGGLIAEEVHDAGLTEFVAYDNEGRPDALHYGNMVALLVKAVQELKAELDTLKGNI